MFIAQHDTHHPNTNPYIYTTLALLVALHLLHAYISFVVRRWWNKDPIHHAVDLDSVVSVSIAKQTVSACGGKVWRGRLRGLVDHVYWRTCFDFLFYNSAQRAEHIASRGLDTRFRLFNPILVWTPILEAVRSQAMLYNRKENVTVDYLSEWATRCGTWAGVVELTKRTSPEGYTVPAGLDYRANDFFDSLCDVGFCECDECLENAVGELPREETAYYITQLHSTQAPQGQQAIEAKALAEKVKGFCANRTKLLTCFQDAMDVMLAVRSEWASVMEGMRFEAIGFRPRGPDGLGDSAAWAEFAQRPEFSLFRKAMILTCVEADLTPSHYENFSLGELFSRLAQINSNTIEADALAVSLYDEGAIPMRVAEHIETVVPILSFLNNRLGKASLTPKLRDNLIREAQGEFGSLYTNPSDATNLFAACLAAWRGPRSEDF